MPSEDDSAFAANLSRVRHALRTPAGHIIGYAEMMAEDAAGEVSDEVVRDLQAVASSGERLVAAKWLCCVTVNLGCLLAASFRLHHCPANYVDYVSLMTAH